MANKDCTQTVMKYSTDGPSEDEFVILEPESRSIQRSTPTDTAKSEQDRAKEKRDINSRKKSADEKAISKPTSYCGAVRNLFRDKCSNLQAYIPASLKIFTNKGTGSPKFQEVQQEMERELLQNPELLQQAMENSFVESLMANRDYLTEIITKNSEVQELLEQSPELSYVLSSPETLHATIKQARNLLQIQKLIPSGPYGVSSTKSEPNKKDAAEGKAKDTGAKEFEHPNSQPSGSQKFHGSLQSPFQPVMPQSVQNPQLTPEMLQKLQEIFGADCMNSVMAEFRANPEISSQTEIELEEKYKHQLEMMQTLGLQDKEANLQALIATSGDPNEAAERMYSTLKR